MNFWAIIGFAILSWVAIYVATATAGYGFTYGSLTAKKYWLRKQIQEIEEIEETLRSNLTKQQQKEKNNGME